jgi:hypothetical protein
MSIEAINAALKLTDVTSTEKLVLIVLANYANEDNQSWMSQRKMQELTCLKERSVRNALAALEDRQLIAREERKRPNGSKTTDLITLSFVGGVPALNAGGYRHQMPGVPALNAGPEPSTKPSKKVLSLREGDFRDFWNAYPRKVAKPNSEKAYARALGFATHEQIMAGLVLAREHWTDPKFIPHPATWLNGQRWTDEHEPVIAQANIANRSQSRTDARRMGAARALARYDTPQSGQDFDDGGPSRITSL